MKLLLLTFLIFFLIFLKKKKESMTNLDKYKLYRLSDIFNGFVYR